MEGHEELSDKSGGGGSVRVVSLKDQFDDSKLF